MIRNSRPSTREFLDFAKKSKLINLEINLQDALEKAADLERSFSGNNEEQLAGWFIVNPGWFIVTSGEAEVQNTTITSQK